MEFIDWRKSPEKIEISPKSDDAAVRRRSKRYRDYVEDQIREAQERGDFSNLPGEGKPLHFDDETHAGDKALGYHLLKNNGYVPTEVELAKEIRREQERAEVKIERVRHLGKRLRARRVPPFTSEKRAFNTTVINATSEYERTLRELNSKILTLNLIAPALMHLPLLEVERLVQQFRASCPLFEDIPRS
jgi:DnaJ homolog subfamily C member 28